jgi:plastocyanin
MTLFKPATIAAALGALSGLSLAAQAMAQGATKVTIAGFKFAPYTVTAAPNAAITWTNNDGAPHQVVIASKNLKTPVLNKGQSAELKISEAGSYDYVCGIHSSMTGKVVVK